ncbi:chemotaxis protein CheA [Thioalkalivibrio sulfidiphilus]|uniref:chemotaxis protein CheA n=1 Tax=Thioalkalivibrio sulfidiphilus TaxID=1033854 RepID=UPI00036D3601|nr:chemotaxis protein CheA [Thioalkalivibrio sulfidiphilus]
MSIDVSQFVQTFLEESFEGLDVMEAQLLDLQGDDVEAVNTIFRAAHSIKGGAGTFGFAAVGEFTHGVETLLDEMRSGHRSATPELVKLLLESVDCIREMLQAARDGAEVDAARIATVGAAIEASLGKGEAASADGEAAHGEVNVSSGWHIRFVPEPEVLRTGNDPLRLFAALEELGPLQVQCDLDRLPPFADMDAEACWLAWDLRLEGDASREAVAEVFEWVEDQCELLIEPLREDEGAGAEEDAPESVSPPPVSGATSGTPVPIASVPGSAVPASAASAKSRPATESSSIRVNIDKIDALINMVGELVITQSMLSQVGERLEGSAGADNLPCLEKLLEGLAQLERNTRELQESVMGIRMLPISFAFNRFPRMVHDLGAKLGKQVQLKLSGEQTELDKTVMEKIGDPLVHLVRNSIDHGIETPEVRVAAGKPAAGEVHLNAFHKGGNIVIQISDDGAGLNRDRILNKAVERGLVAPDQVLSDEQIHDLIFAPGFSTAEQVSDVSGRGVGMDVVRKNIKALGGSVEVQSRPGEGSTFTIRLPLTLAILDGQLVEVDGERYVVPLISIVESIQVRPEFVKSVAERRLVYRLRDEYIPILFLDALLGAGARPERQLTDSLLVVVEAEGQKLALVVDDLLGQQQVVIKALETNFRRVEGLSGATILGDGTVALILDVSGLMTLDKQAGGQPGWRPSREHEAA